MGWTVRLIAGLGGLLLSAQDPDLKEGLEALLRVQVLSASKVLQYPRMAPAKVVVITAEDLRARGYLDLEEALHDLAGFDFEKGMGVHWSQIYMRGLRSTNSDRFLFIWDGVIQNDLNAQVSWLERQFPIAGVERIEILFGPASLLWGSNAFSGIINVILKHPATQQGGEFRLMTGPWRTRMAEFSFGGERGPFSFSLTGKVLRSDEWDWADEWWTDRAGRRRYYGLRPENYDRAALAQAGNVGPDGALRVWMGNRYVPWPDRQGGVTTRDRFLQARVGFNGFNLRLLHWRREESEDKWSTPLQVVNSSWIPFLHAIHLEHQGGMGERGESRSYAVLRVMGLDPETRESEPTAVFTPGDPRDLQLTALGRYGFYNLQSREYRLGHQMSFAGPSASAVFGAEAVFSRIQENYSVRYATEDPWPDKPIHNERNMGLFANAQVDLAPRFSLAAGMRYDYNWEAGGRGGFGHLLTSRLAGIYLPDARNTFKVILGQAFQEPPVFKRYTTLHRVRPLPSPDLRPEKLSAVEVQWERIHEERRRISLSVYLNLVDDKIEQVSRPNPAGSDPAVINKFENVGKVLVYGFEAEARGRFTRGLSAYLGLGGARARDLRTGNPTGGIAPLQAQGGIEHKRGGLGLSLRGRWVARRETQNAMNPSPYVVGSVNAYATVDFSLTWEGLVKGMELVLSAYNLTNERYYDPAPRSGDGTYYNGVILQQPRRAFLGMTYRF